MPCAGLDGRGHPHGRAPAAKRAGLRVSMPFLFGIPGETYEEGLKTIEFALEIDPDLANFHCITPLPRDRPLRQNREVRHGVGRSARLRTYQGTAFVPYTMTREQIHALPQLAFPPLYSRPAVLARSLLDRAT